MTAVTPTIQAGHQVGRSLPRLEAREKVTGHAEFTHLMRLPGMLHAKIFRSTVPMDASNRSTSAQRIRSPASTPSIPVGMSAGSSRILITAQRFMISRSSHRQGTFLSASRLRSC